MERKVALQIGNTLRMEALFQAMSEVGFRYVAVALGDKTPLLDAGWEKYVAGIEALLEKYNLKCVQTHSPYYSLMLSAEHRTEEMDTALLRAVKATKMLGAEICAVHPRSVINDPDGFEDSIDRARSLQENITAFAPLVEQCEKDGTYLGIENLPKWPNDGTYFYSWIAEDHRDVIDALGSKHAVAVWDFGHANMIETDHVQRIQTLGSRIKGSHVHANNALNDQHLPPFITPEALGARPVDWKSVLPALKATGYDGYLTLETHIYDGYPAAPLIRYLYESVCELENIMNG